MTKREREQVVELLRCAADWNIANGTSLGLLMAAIDLGLIETGRLDDAWDACDAVEPWLHQWAGFVDCVRLSARSTYALLEAAQRVEDGEWP